MLAKLMHRFPKLFFKLMASDKNVLGHFLDVASNKLTYKEYLRWIKHRAPVFFVQRAIEKMLILKELR
jgi:hypothetical protein